MSGSRHAAWRIALIAVGAVIAVLAAVTAALWAYLHSTVVFTVSVDGGALVSPDGRTVSVTAASLCDQTDTLIAREQPASVTLTVQIAEPRNPPCSGMPGFAVYRAQLQAPLGRRKLLDGSTGRPVPFFDSRHLLRPAYLPPGYAFRYDAPNAYYLLGYEYLAPQEGPTASCSQLYSDGSDDDLLVVTQAIGGRLEWPPRLRPRPVLVRGRRALEIPGRISWAQDGQTIVVATTDTALPTSELLQVAEGLA